MVASRKLNLLVIVGPTASGKTALSIEIAKKNNGEIISADSRAIYKYLDIGSAKPTTKERSDIPHWGFDLVGPGVNFTAADFKKYATSRMEDICSRGKLPILVGGTGLYVDSVIYNFSFAPANLGLRKKIEDMSNDQLKEIILAKKLNMPINHNNRRHLTRTIERAGHKTTKRAIDSGTLIIGINPGKEVLNNRIELRLNSMLDNGVVDEIKFCANSYGWDSNAMTGGIYRAFKNYIEGDEDIYAAKKKFIKSDKALAKRQMTWFKRNHGIKWFVDSREALNWFDEFNKGKL